MTTLRKLPEEAPPPSHVEEVKFASDGLGGALFPEIDDNDDELIKRLADHAFAEERFSWDNLPG